MNSAAYWDSYHLRSEGSSSGCEWYACEADSSAAIASVRRLLGDATPARVALHIGCGSSLLGDALEAEGLCVINTDFSPVCVAWQRARRAASHYLVADVREDARSAIAAALHFPHVDSVVDLVVDKGTFDALLQRGGQEAVNDAARAFGSLIACTRGWSQCGYRGGGDCDGVKARSAMAILSIIPPSVRMPELVSAIQTGLAICLQPVAALVPFSDASGLRIVCAFACGPLHLTAVEIPLQPLELPSQRFSYVYYLTVGDSGTG